MGECFFWYRLTRAAPDKGLKRLLLLCSRGVIPLNASLSSSLIYCIEFHQQLNYGDTPTQLIYSGIRCYHGPATTDDNDDDDDDDTDNTRPLLWRRRPLRCVAAASSPLTGCHARPSAATSHRALWWRWDHSRVVRANSQCPHDP